MKSVTDLIARADHDMRSAEEAGNGRRVCMKKALLRLGNTISAPVDLHILEKIALIIRISSEVSWVPDLHSHSGPSREQMHTEFCSETMRIECRVRKKDKGVRACHQRTLLRDLRGHYRLTAL